MYGDIKTRFDRIGYSIVLRKIATTLFFIALVVITLNIIAIVLTKRTTAEMEYKHTIAQIRYDNIKH